MRTSAFISFALAVAAGSSAVAQNVAVTPAAGYFKLTARGAGDSLVAVPLLKRSALMGRVTAVGPNTLTLSVSGVTDNAFTSGPNGGYYAQFVTGNLEGVSFKVLANTAAAVFTLVTGTDDLTNHVLGSIASGAKGDVVRILPYWSLGDVFGATSSGLLLDQVTAPLSETYLAGDEILFFDNDSTGTDKKPSAAFAYVSGTGWRRSGDAVTDASTTGLPPGLPFVVRRQNASGVTALLTGYTAPERFLFRLPAIASGEDRDVAVAFAFPAEHALIDSNLFSLVPSFGAIEVSPDATNLRDVVLEFGGDHPGFGVPPAHRYSFSGTSWFEADINADAHLLQPGTGYLLRLRGARATRYWQQLAPP